MEKTWTADDQLFHLEQRVAALECMVEVSRITASAMNLSELLEIILQVAMQLTHTEAASVMLLDEDTGELYFEAATGPTRNLVERFVVPQGRGISGWALTHDEPLIVNDVSSDPRHYATVDRSTGYQTHSMMAAPLRFREEAIGVIAVINHQDEEEFSDQDLRILVAMATQAAIAIENARLFDAQVQAMADLELANQRLQELDKLKSAFIGVITHELRTPFANLSFSLELLERYGKECWLPEQHEQIAQLKQGVESAREMVDNLTNFATFLGKQGELRLDWVDVDQTVSHTIAPLRRLAEGKGIDFRLDVQPDLPPIRADQDRLSDAVYHLVQNAYKFTDQGGSIWIRCRKEEGRLRLEVRDTGIGIPPEKLPGLWKGFAQMADPLRRGVEGLGLGLTLVKYIVNAHGGQVFADSREGLGSIFGFWLPMKQKKLPPTHPI
jgi:K+-sensing histidine kinase KdpD